MSVAGRDGTLVWKEGKIFADIDRSGKTTIARLIAQTAGTRFVEINSTSSGVAECKKLFTEAQNERGLTGRKTIIFCEFISTSPPLRTSCNC